MAGRGKEGGGEERGGKRVEGMVLGEGRVVGGKRERRSVVYKMVEISMLSLMPPGERVSKL